jgi:type IV pilus assembly protein PilQ
MKMAVNVLLAAALIAAALVPALGPVPARAQAAAASNSVERVEAVQTADGVLLTIQLRSPLKDTPPSFSVANPARIAIDLARTDNNVGRNALEFNQGDLRSVNIVQAQERTRLVLNLRRSLNHSIKVSGNTVQVALGGLVEATTFRSADATPAASTGVPAAAPSGQRALRSVDFRRGAEGEGRVLVDLSDPNTSVDIREQGNRVIVDFLGVSAPESLRRQLDVTDFGTPIALVNTTQQGGNVRMVIEPRGAWEYNAYQSDTRFVVEVKPIKEDPSRLIQGTRPGYQGERLSLNFQNVDVRALLQVIADFTDLNIITSDSVGGSITLRLKDVPWDQALDIILQSKGLDMRKNGNVVIVAPRDELAAKEKLDLEARSQIADLAPLRAEAFVVNYQKADDVRKLLIDGQQRMLSKRGTVVVDPRTNQLFVRDTAPHLEEVRRLLQRIDVPVPQVLIEARIVEADDTFSRNLGVRLGGSSGYPRQVGGSGAYATGGGLGITSSTGPGGTVNTGTAAPGGQGTITSPSVISNANFVNLPAAAIGGFGAAGAALTLFNASLSRFLSLEVSALEADGRDPAPRGHAADHAGGRDLSRRESQQGQPRPGNAVRPGDRHQERADAGAGRQRRDGRARRHLRAAGAQHGHQGAVPRRHSLPRLPVQEPHHDQRSQGTADLHHAAGCDESVAGTLTRHPPERQLPK